ncbi:RNA-binding (RRM/RBD/RNP motif) family protein [Abeliophyllum distichum]|uniref:RNA-binding (RRM/RBD/RNP motif) family protein n=1 Tax=Abeliophyllum distichum TaxID=126358 RepID=A0ABD1PAL0_9LAMI
MPPRKKTPAGPGTRRATRARETQKAQAQPGESNLKLEEEEVEVKVEVMVEEENLPVATEDKEKVLDPKNKVKVESEENGEASVKKDEGVKESVEECEKDELLDLEDNDPEYEREEFGGVDYDEKETGLDPQEEEEPVEVNVGGEAEGYLIEEEMEGMHEEPEPQEDGGRVREEHAEIVDAAEEEEHHEVVKEKLKRKEFEIFVGGLDKDATEDDLRKVFSEVGNVTDVRLMMNPQTKKNKGFAFLRFATVEQAKRAFTELKNPLVRGKQCGVTPIQDSDTLFLGNICRTWTKEALKEKLKHYGIENIEDLTLVEDSNSVGMNRGFAFLEFPSRSDAMDAFKRLQKRDVLFGVDRPAKVSFADSFIDPGDEIMTQVKTVFVDGLPASWDEDLVRELLTKYGEIEKVELARNMPSARRKDFGFVSFDTHDAAVNCANSINNEELGTGDNKAKVRARLSRPQQRGKGNHVARPDFRPGRVPIRGVRSPWGHPVRRNIPLHGTRGSRLPPIVEQGFRRPTSIQGRRPVLPSPPRSRPVAPLPRSYDRRPPVLSYPKRGLNKDYDRREELPPRSRAATDYSSRTFSDRHESYGGDYSFRASGYSDLPRAVASRTTERRAHVDDGYGQRYERPPTTYHEGRAREYDSMSGSKRTYAAADNIPPRYTEAGERHSRARLDYDVGSSGAQYGDAYSDRYGRSNLGYGGSRSSLSSHDSHGLYGTHQDMGYSGGSYSGSDAGMYSSSYVGDYMSRGNDVGGSSYSSLHSGHGLSGRSYMGSGSSGSYY